jgi:predicted thioredoxin/glutaredoxin
MHNFKANYEVILKVLKQISKETLLPYQRRKSMLSDILFISARLFTQGNAHIIYTGRVFADGTATSFNPVQEWFDFNL